MIHLGVGGSSERGTRHEHRLLKSWKSHVPGYWKLVFRFLMHILLIIQNITEKVLHSNLLFATKFFEKWIKHILNVDDLELKPMYENALGEFNILCSTTYLHSSDFTWKQFSRFPESQLSFWNCSQSYISYSESTYILQYLVHFLC